MPKFMELFGYKIYFWSNESDPIEPVHVHISKNPHRNATKVWILSNGDCLIDNNNDKIPQKDLKRLINAISEFSEEIKDLWKDHFSEISFYDEEKEIEIEI